MAELMAPVFLTITAHGTMLFCSIFDKDEYIYASLPPQPELKNDYEDLEASIGVCLSLSLTFTIFELFLLFRQISPRPVFLYSIFSHSISCLFLLKFIIDLHPVAHFWMLFAFGTCPTFFTQLILLVNSYNKKKFC